MADSSAGFLTQGVGLYYWNGSVWAPVTSADPLPVFTPFAATSGLSIIRFVSAATNNKTTVAAGPGRLYGISVQSIAAAGAAYLKAFNDDPTMGTTPCFDQWSCPAASATQGTGIVLQWPAGLIFPAGIYVALTGGIALADNTAVAANAFNVSIYYYAD